MNYTLNHSYFSSSLNSLSLWCCNDLDKRQEQQLQSHISAQDYFGTLATVLSLMSQSLDVQLKEGHKDMVREVIDELDFLQQNYKISSKNTKSS